MAAAVLLLLVVRPNLGGRTPVPGTFTYWARMDADAIRASMGADTRSARVEALSTSAFTKHKRLERAVDTILAALGPAPGRRCSRRHRQAAPAKRRARLHPTTQPSPRRCHVGAVLID
ncbi:Pycsar system effector family protein [Streptomyces sp. NPDC058322]|uniref:Pycsar system effector family protein n=1 Tax=unclassified Streptomyces TaxID=2593676 RepID=UPI00342D4AB1